MKNSKKKTLDVDQVPIWSPDNIMPNNPENVDRGLSGTESASNPSTYEYDNDITSQNPREANHSSEK